jgi:hypothetical protein
VNPGWEGQKRAVSGLTLKVIRIAPGSQFRVLFRGKSSNFRTASSWLGVDAQKQRPGHVTSGESDNPNFACRWRRRRRRVAAQLTNCREHLASIAEQDTHILEVLVSQLPPAKSPTEHMGDILRQADLHRSA